MIDAKRRVRYFRDPPSPVLSLPTEVSDEGEEERGWLGKGMSFLMSGVTAIGFGVRLGLFR